MANVIGISDDQQICVPPGRIDFVVLTNTNPFAGETITVELIRASDNVVLQSKVIFEQPFDGDPITEFTTYIDNIPDDINVKIRSYSSAQVGYFQTSASYIFDCYLPPCDLGINNIIVTPAVNGGANGSVEFVVTSSYPTYQYRFNEESIWYSGRIVTGLLPGVYNIDIRDGHPSGGCIEDNDIIIENSSCNISITSLFVTNETGEDLNDGTLTVIASSTAGGYQFRVDGGAFASGSGNTKTFTGLAPGIHTVFVRDSGLCEVSQNFEVLEHVAIDPDCFDPVIVISEINPYKFKLLKCNSDDETELLFNEIDICGVNKDCFTQIAKCNDVLTIQLYYSDVTYNTVPKLNVLDYYDNTLYETIDFVSLASGYYKLEKNINEILNICEKTVYLVVKSRNNVNSTEYFEHAKSEPILVSNYHDCTLLLEYWNDNNFNSMRYEGGGVGYVNKLRINAQAWQEEFPQDKEVYEKSNGEIVLIKSQVKEKRMLKVGYVPNYIHKIIALALSHQHVRINNVEYVCEEEYSFENLDRYALSKGKAKLSTKQYLKKNLIK
jgi:hypothetical protein